MALQRPTRLVMGPCIVEIDHIVIREVQYQLEVNRCRNEEIIVKDNLGWVWPMWAGRSRIDRIVIREVQYQFEVNRYRNEEIISMWAGRPRIYRIVIREVQCQFEVNRCRNEEIIVKGNFGLVWSMWAGRPRIDRMIIRDVQYQFEVNRLKGNFGWAWSTWADAPGLVMGPCIVEIDCIVIRDFQGSCANSVGGDSGQDGQTDGR
ncbi:hypothetical protein DPMN_132156 [Dreissena polymorpha]|uniref:Uncharacterized protein n=1 Tax=Dreissena polymorpha TaxID=45954 RepID=A0A9D4J8M1_DREPO|nr:hypothetical protein DPMN_132156 [Dreissena polymorpha]